MALWALGWVLLVKLLIIGFKINSLNLQSVKISFLGIQFCTFNTFMDFCNSIWV